MTTLNDLVAFISSRRAVHDRAFESDVARLRVKYGNGTVDEALAMSRQGERRDALSISGARRRRREEHANARRLQNLFRSPSR
jgi:hypothetical protein